MANVIRKQMYENLSNSHFRDPSSKPNSSAPYCFSSFLCTSANAQIVSGKVINRKKQLISNVDVTISGS
ncbi:hypothetical protein [Sphingobacterium mizutaii]|uniref:hypothetical protein n=1 Tax=Sphingobacterium mizutaii TaxID=1010 RepID=UPI000B80AC5A|nr:hypothetical protein [Sphingobacterium mizutaii]